MDFINMIHQGEHGWLRADYHKFLVAADHRAQYVQQRKLQDMARQQVQADEQFYVDRGRASFAATREHRECVAEQKAQLKRSKSDGAAAMRNDASERAQLLALKKKAYADHAARCIHEAKSLNASARRTRSDVEEMRKQAADAMRAKQASAKQAAHEEAEKRDQAVRALYESVRGSRVPSPSRGVDELGTPFSALTAADKAAVDEANADALAARQKAQERALLSRKKAQARATEASKGARVVKNLSQIVREQALAKAAALKEKARIEAEQAAAAAAAHAAAEARAAQEAARAAAEAEAAEAAARVEREAEEAAAAEQRKKRARAEAKKKAFADRRDAAKTGGKKMPAAAPAGVEGPPAAEPQATEGAPAPAGAASPRAEPASASSCPAPASAAAAGTARGVPRAPATSAPAPAAASMPSAACG